MSKSLLAAAVLADEGPLSQAQFGSHRAAVGAGLEEGNHRSATVTVPPFHPVLQPPVSTSKSKSGRDLLFGVPSGGASQGSISTVAALASPTSRGEALAGLFLAGYLGGRLFKDYLVAQLHRRRITPPKTTRRSDSGVTDRTRRPD